jgi:hypothetical protein
MRDPRGQPHSNNHRNEWRSARSRRADAGVDPEAACRLAIATFMQQQGQRDGVPD